MSHCSSEEPLAVGEGFQAELDKLAAKLALGPTGQFPDGQIAPTDQGEFKYSINANPKTKLVHVDFGVPLREVALTPEQASEMGDLLIRAGLEARNIT